VSVAGSTQAAADAAEMLALAIYREQRRGR
jgi:hypothetical protein